MSTESGISTNSILLDVVSDVVCPWCFVGKRRIELAAKLLGRDILIRWRPFQLNPSMPVSGMDRLEYRVRKFGSLERSQLLDQQLRTVGHQVGIEFRQDLIKRSPNTQRAHVLLQLALQAGVEVQARAAERLFVGYFSRGEDVGDPQTLVNMAKELNIAAVTGPETLDDPALREAIRKQEEESRLEGVQAVPNISYKRQLVASGAQPEELLAKSLRALLQQSGVQA